MSFVSDAPLKSVSNFEFTNTLRDDGRYAITLSPKSWSAPLAAGSAQSSYYQGSGDFSDPNRVFDLAATSAEVAQPEAPQQDAGEAVEPPVAEDSPVTEGGDGHHRLRTSQRHDRQAGGDLFRGVGHLQP